MKSLRWGCVRTEGPSLGTFIVKSTELRFGATGDYLVQVNLERKAQVGCRAIITTVVADNDRGNARAVLAQVEVDAGLDYNEIRVDRALRDALLIDIKGEVSLYRVIGWNPGLVLQWLFKPRRLWAYVFRSSHRDAEKGLCTVAPTTLQILRLENMGQVRVEYVFFDPVEKCFKVGSATPTVFELSAGDAEHTYAEMEQEAKKDKWQHVAGARELDDYRSSIFRKAEGEKLSLPFIRLDKDARMDLANDNLVSWERNLVVKPDPQKQGSEAGPREMPYFAPVRLSPSIPFIFRAHSVIHVINASVGLIGAVLAGTQIAPVAGIVIGSVYLFVFLPSSIYWDIRRRVSYRR